MTQETDICQNRHQGNPESDAAFKQIVAGLPFMRAEVLLRIHRADLAGLTVHELAEQLGTTPNTVSGRLTELKKEGRIRKVGMRPTPSGCRAAVYCATDLDSCYQKLLFEDE